MKIGENDVTVVCRKADEASVNKVLNDAVSQARTLLGNDKLNATLTTKFYLSPARSPTNQTDAW